MSGRRRRHAPSHAIGVMAGGPGSRYNYVPQHRRRQGAPMADEELGPIDYLIVEFPGSRMTGEGFPILVDLVDRGLIRIIDLVFVTKAADGTTTMLELADLDGDGSLDLSVFEGASSGVIDDSDVADAATVLDAGSSAAILIYENRWAAPFAAALRRGGAELVARGGVPIDALVASLAATGS